MNSEFTLVDKPLIKHVFDQIDGKEHEAGSYLFLSDREISQLRMKIFDALDKKSPIIICAACHNPVYPRKSNETSRFHFAHVHEDDQTQCPYKSNDGTQDTDLIDSMRYNGSKEGSDHKLIKRLLRTSIDADPSFDPDQTHEEKNWYHNIDKKKWRRPDVSAVIRQKNEYLRIAFEIQLSSTFLKVIAARRRFYLEDNAFVFWIFKDATGINPRQYQDDLFYNNNSNLFVVDEDTVRLSQDQSKLTFRCCYYEPVLSGTTITDEWRERVVSIEELTFDRENQRVYWFDYDAEKTKLLEAAESIIRKEQEEALRDLYIDFWTSLHMGACKDPEGEYGRLRQQLLKHGISVPDNYNQGIFQFTRLVFSAKTGEPFLTGHPTLLQVANNAYAHVRQFLTYFGRVLNHYKTWDTLIEQDRHAAGNKKFGKEHVSWFEKKEIINQKIKDREPGFKQNRDYDKLFSFLFPEIKLPKAE